MKPSLPLVSFEVTMSCNLKCRFCYNHYKNDNKTLEPSNYKIARKTLVKLFKTFSINQITFTGGEPFMGERFNELVLTARLKGAKVGIISNGNFAQKENYIQISKLGVTLFELPMHSYNPEIHDFMTRCKGSHKKSLEIVSTLLQNQITPVAVIVLTKFNAENAYKTVEYINSLGIKKIMLNRYNIGGEGVKNAQEILPTKNQLQNAYAEISQTAKKHNLTIMSSVCTPICILNPKDYMGITFSSCSFDIKKRPVTVDYLGNVRFCNHSPEILGNIFSNTADEIYHNPLLKNWENIIPEYCKNCNDYSRCKAGCRAASQQCGLTLNHPDPIINFYNNTL